jgi:membrane fusion protein (multidrug efflux system)
MKTKSVGHAIACRRWNFGRIIRHAIACPTIALIVAGCGHKEKPAAELPAVRVETVEAQLTRTPDVFEVAGTVRPKLWAEVSSKVMAGILEIPVKAGDAVGAGQLLAKLDDRELRAEFDRAKADFDRYKTLLEKQAVTRAEFDAVQSRYRVAEAALSYAQIVAPFDGVVARKLAEVGDMAAPGKPLLVVEAPFEYRLEANVPERFPVALGAKLHVVIDATGEKCVGEVGEVVPAADPASRSYLVKINLQCRQPLKSGMFGRAQFLRGERFAIFVPKNAVHERGQLTYVFVAGDGRAQMRLVKTGKSYLDAVEILSGLQSGERIVISSEQELTDGSPIAGL